MKKMLRWERDRIMRDNRKWEVMGEIGVNTSLLL
jgi:hypothetical protein